MLIKTSFYVFLLAIFVMAIGVTNAFNDMNKNLYLKQSLETRGLLTSGIEEADQEIIVANIENK